MLKQQAEFLQLLVTLEALYLFLFCIFIFSCSAAVMPYTNVLSPVVLPWRTLSTYSSSSGIQMS